MTEYFVIKREPCTYPPCMPIDEGAATMDFAWEDPCPHCHGTRFVETRINADEWLLSRLKVVQWGEEIEPKVYAYNRLYNVKFED